MNNYFSDIFSALKAFHIKEQKYNFISALFWLMFVAVSAVLVLVLTESILHLSSSARTAIVIIFSTLIFLALFFLIGKFLYSIFSSFDFKLVPVAKKVGTCYESIKDRLANALQVFLLEKENKQNYSPELIDATLAEIHNEIKNKNFANLLTLKQFSRLFWILLLEVIVVIALICFPYNLNSAFVRLVHPGVNYSIESLYALNVKPGNVTVVKGEDVTIKAWSDIPGLSEMSLGSSNKSHNNALLQKTQDDTFRYTIKSISDSLSYFVSAGELKSQNYSLSVLELPLLRQLRIKVVPPGYSRLEPYFLEDNVGNISALKGSLVELSGEANKSLSEATISFSQNKAIQMDVIGNRIKANFSIKKDDSYFISLKDKNDLSSQNPIDYQIDAILDQFPFVKIVSPGEDIDLAEDMIIPLAIEASDDFGLSKVQLVYQLIPEGVGDVDSSRFIFQDLNGIKVGSEQLSIAFNWDLKSSEMMPTDVIAYFVKVYDNDNVSGPKSAESRIYTARFPSMFEMYEELAGDQEKAVESMENMQEKAQNLKEKLDKMALEMRRAEEIDWQQKQEIEDALKTQKEIQEEMEELSEKLDEMISNMEKNDLVSAETMKKYEELQQLAQEIMSPELQQAMQNVSDAMKNLDQKMVQKALEELKLTQEDLNNSLDRSIALMKKLKLEQQLDQALKITEDLLERQEQIQKEMDSKEADSERTASEQDKINKDVEKLSKQLDELNKEMSDMPGMPQEEISQAQSQLSDEEFKKQLEQLQKNLQNGDKGQNQQMTQNIQQQMQNARDQLQLAKDSMSGAMQKQMMQAMKQATNNLLQLSKQQESLMQQTQGMPKNSPQISELAEKQNNMSSALSRTLDQMFQDSKQNVFMSSKIGKSLGKASASMQQSQQQFEERNLNNATASQGQAMSSLNEAFKALQESMQQMMQSSGSGGMSMEQFLKQMQQMGQQQQGINQQTMGLGMGQQMSLAKQAAMARLGANQQQVRKSAEQLAKEAGGLDQMLGDMDKMVEDMKEIEKDFQSNNISRETIERQNRILSRMLDAQKSMREREYTNKRQAETGKNYIARNPNALPDDLGERASRLQQDLLRAKKEGYTKDYLDLIEKYFKAISDQNEKNN